MSSARLLTRRESRFDSLSKAAETIESGGFLAESTPEHKIQNEGAPSPDPAVNSEGEAKEPSSALITLREKLAALKSDAKVVVPSSPQEKAKGLKAFQGRVQKKVKVGLVAANKALKILSLYVKYYLLWLIKEVPPKLFKLINTGLAAVKDFLLGVVHAIKSWSRRRKILFVLSVLGLSVISFVYIKVLKEKTLHKETFYFYSSFEQIGTLVMTVKDDDSFEPFYNSPRVKTYSFQMKPVVVNLKRKNPEQENPMGFFEFVFEGNSGDVVIELKDRETEFIDLIERVIEGHRYEQLDTLEGKAELKKDLRREMNILLNDGVIRRVEIRNFFIKP